MRKAKSYRPVYLFTDEKLSHGFFNLFTQAQLVEPFQKNKSLRERTLRGRRVGQGKPSKPDLINIYNREILENGDQTLINHLYLTWVKLNFEVSQKAVLALNFEIDNEDPNAWISEAKSRIENIGQMAAVAKIARMLTGTCDDLAIHIVVSMLSYEYEDQHKLCERVQSEILMFRNDPELKRSQLLDQRLKLVSQISESKKDYSAKSEKFKSGIANTKQKIDSHESEILNLNSEWSSENLEFDRLSAELAEIRQIVDKQKSKCDDLTTRIEKDTRQRDNLNTDLNTLTTTQANTHKVHSKELIKAERFLRELDSDLVSIEAEVKERAKEADDTLQKGPDKQAPSPKNSINPKIISSYLNFLREDDFTSSVATLALIRDQVDGKLLNVNQQQAPSNTKVDTANEWEAYYSIRALNANQRWNREDLTMYAIWKSLEQSALSKERRLNFLFSALYHSARVSKPELTDKVIIRSLQAWSDWPTPTSGSSQLAPKLANHIEALLRNKEKLIEFGVFQSRLAFANHAALLRFYDLTPLPLRLLAKSALAAWLSNYISANDKEATHELVEAVSNLISTRTATLDSFTRSWKGTATIETLFRERNKLLASAAKAAELFSELELRELDALRLFYGNDLSELRNTQSMEPYRELLIRLATHMYSSADVANHFYSRFIQPLLLVLHDAVERASLDARKSLKSTLDLVIEKTQLPLAGEPRNLTLNIRIENTGNIDAKDISLVILPTKDNQESVADIETDDQVFSVAAGQIREIALKLVTKKSCDVVHLEYLVSWRDTVAKERSTSGLIKLTAQREIDWRAAKVNPFTLRSIASAHWLYGRESEREDLSRGILASSSYLLTGQRRVGKTSLARVLVSTFSQEEEFCSLYIPLGELSTQNSSSFLLHFFEAIYDAHKNKPDWELDFPSETDFQKDPHANGMRFMRRIETAIPKLKYLIVLDDFDELPEQLYSGDEGDALFLLLRALIDRGNISFIFVGGERLPQIMRLQGERLNQVTTLKLDYLADQSRTAKLLRERTSEFLEYPDVSTTRVHELSAGNPFYTTKLAARIYDDMVERQDHYVSLADVTRNVTGLTAEDDVNSYQHFWKEGVFLAGPDLEQAQHINALILIALSELERETESTSSKDLFKHKLLDKQDQQFLQHRLDNLVSRKVVRQSELNFSIRIPLFSRWLQGSGASEVRASFGAKDTHYQFSRGAEGIADSAIVDLAKDLMYQDKHVNETRIGAWLAQFSDAYQQKLAFKLLKRIAGPGYFSAKNVHDAFKGLHALIIADLGSNTNQGAEYVRKRIVNIFISHFDREGKSGSTMLYQYRQATSIHHALSGSVQNAVDYLRGLNGPGVVVFVDDFIGSGGTCIEGMKKFSVLCESAGIDVSDHSIYVATLAGTRAGIDFSKQSCPEISNLFVHKELGADDLAFSVNSNIFEGERERLDALAMCRTIGSQLEKKHPLGFDDSQALLVFPHRCPNNTLPIFYKSGRRYEGKEWIPLFER